MEDEGEKSSKRNKGKKRQEWEKQEIEISRDWKNFIFRDGGKKESKEEKRSRVFVRERARLFSSIPIKIHSLKGNVHVLYCYLVHTIV